MGKRIFDLWASKNLVGPGHPRPSARLWEERPRSGEPLRA